MVANAGHIAPYLNGKDIPDEARFPLGIVTEILYAESSFQTNGSKVTWLSDGVIEAQNAQGELPGFERMAALTAKPAAAIADAAVSGTRNRHCRSQLSHREAASRGAGFTARNAKARGIHTRPPRGSRPGLASCHGTGRRSREIYRSIVDSGGSQVKNRRWPTFSIHYPVEQTHLPADEQITPELSKHRPMCAVQAVQYKRMPRSRMKSKFKVDRGSCSTTQDNSEDVTGLMSRPTGHAWQLVDDVERLLGDYAEPDPLFFVESWTIGVPRAIRNWEQRGQEREDYGPLNSLIREPDNVRTLSFANECEVYEEYLSSAQPDANAGGYDSGSSQQSDEDLATWTEEKVLQEWDACAEECDSNQVTVLAMTMVRACRVLGVSANCTRKEIKAAYRRKVIQWHPDRLGCMTKETRMRATEQMAVINEAYRLLRIGVL